MVISCGFVRQTRTHELQYLVIERGNGCSNATSYYCQLAREAKGVHIHTLSYENIRDHNLRDTGE